MLLPLMSFFFFLYECVCVFVSFLFFFLSAYPSSFSVNIRVQSPSFFFFLEDSKSSLVVEVARARRSKVREVNLTHVYSFFFFCISPCLSLILSHSRFLCVAKVREKKNAEIVFFCCCFSSLHVFLVLESSIRTPR